MRCRRTRTGGPRRKRVAVIFAGPCANLVFCIVVLAVVFMLGVPAGVTRAVEHGDRRHRRAAAMGLQPDDVIVAVDGAPTTNFEDIRDAIGDSEGEPVALTVRRDGEHVELARWSRS